MPQLQRLAVNPAQIYDRTINLTAEQQHYLNRVLRLQAGDRFIAMDGRGHWWSAILEAQETGLFASITEEIAVNRELPATVTLIAALPKGNGFDEVVRQATELGVASIVPVTSDRTLLKPSPQKVDRWRRIAAEAAEQSERQIVPTVYEPVSFDFAVKDCRQKYRFICAARGNNQHLWDCLAGLEPPQPPGLRGEQEPDELSTVIAGLEPPQPPGLRGEKEPDELSTVIAGLEPPQPPGLRGEQELEPHFVGAVDGACVPPAGAELSIAIAVGPEGGWTDGEVERAIEFGFEPVSLGRRILRAVTAPMVALSLVGAAFEKYPSQKIFP
ncbi:MULTISPECIES: 16S rRNA (uracil(1498)-N(3))-methyltransferase [unclassified Microcoleus]|uniref:RsmE family RNA methyltransferase n=1 Tax=unclassified Microcoleus TaxID=2642155 RepID=UPI002FD6C442